MKTTTKPFLYELAEKYKNSAKFKAVVATIFQTAFLAVIVGLGLFLDTTLGTFLYKLNPPPHWDTFYYILFCFLAGIGLLALVMVIGGICSGINYIYQQNLKDVIKEKNRLVP